MQRMVMTPMERKIIDTEINGMINSGYGYLLGSEDPMVMGKLFKKIGGFFKKIGKGVGGLYQKIKQRMKDRGISASVGTPESSFSVGPEGMQISTPKFSYDSQRGEANYYSDAGTMMRFKKGESGGEKDLGEKEPKDNKMMYIAAAAAGALILIVMATKK